MQRQKKLADGIYCGSKCGVSRIFATRDGRLATNAIVDTVNNCLVEAVNAHEFCIEVETRDGSAVVFDVDCECTGITCDDSTLTGEYLSREHGLAVRVIYTTEENLLYKKVEITARGNPVTVLKVWVENIVLDAVLERGGVGQPAFINSTLFAGLEHPVGITAIDGKLLKVGHCPGRLLSSGESLTTHPLVYGGGKTGEVAASFVKYLRRLSPRKLEHWKIYCDWGLHDELSDSGVELTEELTMDALNVLSKLKSKGVEFDYYLMDAFWFDPAGDYCEFKKPNWPEGFDGTYEMMKELGLKFGLWYNVSGGIDKNPELEFCKAQDGHLCLACVEFQEKLSSSIEFFIKEYDLAMIKFDFAVFACDNPMHGHLLDEYAREATVDGLLNVISRARAANPDIAILAYNTFTYDMSWLAPVIPGRSGYPISPWWVKYCDMVYCGDPRPSETPALSLRDSINCYTDHQVGIFKDSLLALEHIDDHGVMVGTTGTVYWEGKNKWRDIWTIMVSRGALKSHFYGDLRLLDEDDVEFMRAMLELVDTYSDAFNSSQRILGEPGKGQVYGYSCVGENASFLTIVNPTFFKQKVAWRELSEEIEVIYSSFEELCLSFKAARADVTLQPFSVIMLKSAACGIEHMTVQQDDTSAIVEPAAWYMDEQGRIIVQTQETIFSHTGISIRLTKDDLPWRGLSDPGQVEARALTHAGELIELKQTPSVRVWSGCSWLVLYGCAEGQPVRFEVRLVIPDGVEVSVWELGW